MKSPFGFWECDHCGKRFVKEAGYNKHKCDMMERAEFLETRRGKFALSVYNAFMTCKKKQKQTKQVFMESKYYNAILKFVEFYYSAMLPDMYDYVDFCCNELDLLPQFWVRNDVYETYINEFDSRITPLEQADITLKHIGGLSNQVECEVHEVFDYMDVSDITRFIQSRRWSPWVLLSSKSFAAYLEQCNQYEAIVLGAMINEDIWSERFRKMPKALKTIQNLTKEFGI